MNSRWGIGEYMTTERPPHITPDDPRGAQAAAQILRRHADGEPEANIISAVRNFLTITGLVQDDEVVEETPLLVEASRWFGG